MKPQLSHQAGCHLPVKASYYRCGISLRGFTEEANVSGNYVHLILLSRTATLSLASLRLPEVCNGHSYQSSEPRISASSTKPSVSCRLDGGGEASLPIMEGHMNNEAQKSPKTDCFQLQKYPELEYHHSAISNDLKHKKKHHHT